MPATLGLNERAALDLSVKAEAIERATMLMSGGRKSLPHVFVIVVPSLRDVFRENVEWENPLAADPNALFPATVFVEHEYDATAFLDRLVTTKEVTDLIVTVQRFEKLSEVYNTPAPRVALRRIPIQEEERDVSLRAIALQFGGTGGREVSFSSQAKGSAVAAAPAQQPKPKLGRDVWSEAAVLQVVTDIAARRGVDPRLVLAVISQESAFNRLAVSPRNARGWMQVLPTTAAQYGVTMTELFEPPRNVYAGVRYLEACRSYSVRYKLEEEQGVLPTVAAYNMGAGRLHLNWALSQAPRETRAYAPAVVAKYREYLEKYPNTTWDQLWPRDITKDIGE